VATAGLRPASLTTQSALSDGQAHEPPARRPVGTRAQFTGTAPRRVEGLAFRVITDQKAAELTDQRAYLGSRFAPDRRREAVWRHVVPYLSRWWGDEDAVLDVGAGYCSFINAVSAARRVAVDIHDELETYAAPGVECVRASASAMQVLDTGTFDVVFASNLLEHLSREDIRAALSEFQRVLRPGGRLILVQPNFRLRPGEYFDDYTHLTPISDRSLADLLTVTGFEIIRLEARFLPLTLRSRGGDLAFLVPLYLRLPWRPLAGQMLAVARRAG
jgi:SAM-dependent methyltransferase